jgi:hypothetical protein
MNPLSPKFLQLFSWVMQAPEETSRHNMCEAQHGDCTIYAAKSAELERDELHAAVMQWVRIVREEQAVLR